MLFGVRKDRLSFGEEKWGFFDTFWGWRNTFEENGDLWNVNEYCGRNDILER